jgi:hypothetical protein
MAALGGTFGSSTICDDARGKAPFYGQQSINLCTLPISMSTTAVADFTSQNLFAYRAVACFAPLAADLLKKSGSVVKEVGLSVGAFDAKTLSDSCRNSPSTGGRLSMGPIHCSSRWMSERMR